MLVRQGAASLNLLCAGEAISWDVHFDWCHPRNKSKYVTYDIIFGIGGLGSRPEYFVLSTAVAYYNP